MPASRRAFDEGTQRARRLLADVGRELRGARASRGLSQRSVARAAGISQPQLSMIEGAKYPRVSIETLARLAVVVGLELGLRTFPGGEPIRDKAHAALLARFRQAVGDSWQWAVEVPLPLPGDKRAWDRVLRRPGATLGVEAETRPTDMQDLQRRLALKKRDGQVDRVILVLADTAWCRRIVRLNDIETMFPISGKAALRALSEGRDPGGDAIVLI